MAWIELHQSLFAHRKTMEAAADLDLPEVYMVGHLAALWCWAIDNAPDGLIIAHPRIIARAAQYPGDAAEFLQALIGDGPKERYLVPEEDGYRLIFDRFVKTSTDEEHADKFRQQARAFAEVIYERDGRRCIYCGSEQDLTIDHRIPVKRGGTNELTNLATACRSCNSSKGAKTEEEWRR